MMKPQLAFLQAAPLLFPGRPLHLPCKSSQTVTATAARFPAKDASVPPPSVKTTGELPPSLYNTTILHNIPSDAVHLDTPLAHPLDGDGYILAVSYQSSGEVWPRARFVRTKAFMAESNAGHRVYKGTHGTPGTTGWQAPLKPKAAAADGVFMWGRGKKRRAFAFGPRSLPLALDLGTLVARGPTAIGSVLTDSPELASERATELAAAPLRQGDSLFIMGLSRSPAGKVLGAFVVEIDRDYEVKTRLPKISIPARCIVSDFAVGERFCVALLHREDASSDSGLLGSLIGQKRSPRESPLVDVAYGSLLMIMPRNGSSPSSVRIPGTIFTSIAGVNSGQQDSLELSVLSIVQESGSVVRRSTLQDVETGRHWDCGDTKSSCVTSRITLTINISMGPRGLAKNLSFQTSEDSQLQSDVSLLCPARGASANGSFAPGSIFTVLERQSGKCGLARLDCSGPKAEIVSTWICGMPNVLLSGPVQTDDGKYVSVLMTQTDSEDAARVMVFHAERIGDGPVHTTELDLEQFGGLAFSVSGVWGCESVDWNEEGSKPLKSAYEIFDSRKWNDIESGFSSLGLGQ